MKSNLAKWILGIIIIIIIITIVATNSRKSVDNVIKIGVVAPLTGSASIFGKSYVGAIKLAQEDLTDTKKTYEVIIEDDGSNPGQAASAAQKLINIDKVQAILSMSSGTGNAIKSIATANKIPHICGCTDTTVANAEYNFTDLVSNDAEAKVWYTEAFKRGIHSIALISQNHPGLVPLAAAMKKNAPEYGVTIVHEEKWEPTTSDFKTIIAKTKATKPDVFFVMGFPPGMDIVGQELRNMGISSIGTSAGFGVSAKPELYEGLWYEDAGITNISFRDRFEAKFPDIRFNVRSAPFGYDSYKMVINGLESGMDLNKYLSSLTTFDGIAGTTTQVIGSRNFYATPRLWIIKNGKAEFYNG